MAPGADVLHRGLPVLPVRRAAALDKGARIEKVRVDLEPARRGEMTQKSGRHTVPQIWIGERHVGGCDDLYALDRKGGLDPLLKATP